MKLQMSDVTFHYVEHGVGMPALVLHGAGVDHREAQACFEPALDGESGLRRIYPDLPGMGLTIAPARLRKGVLHADVIVQIADQLFDRRFPAPKPVPAPVARHARVVTSRTRR